VSGGKDWVSLDDDSDESETRTPLRRLSTGIAELDRVLGGGLVPDSFTLLGGDPGIGKSTLLLQMARGLLETQSDTRVLYVSGEESIDQIRGRAIRLGVSGKGRVFLAAETQLERVFATVKELKPDVVVMDSLQTFSSGFLTAAPGSVSQVREVAARLIALAKTAGISVWLVGHVTKEGSIAGPKVVEHMVDTVLYFEGEGGQSYRLLRTIKNRFGSTRELGVFEMDGEGLREVANPSQLFLSERKEPVEGTAIAASLEGSRPLLVELQALVAPSSLSVPRRTSVGFDGSRVALLAAILERHMRLPLAEEDLFFNVAGGLRLSEPACDLAAAAAIWSSAEEKAIPNDWLFIGELGLTGEVRRVPHADVRIAEAKKLGFKTVVLPRSSGKALENPPAGVRLLTIDRISDLPRLFSSDGATGGKPRGRRPDASPSAPRPSAEQ
jgi:DNA repair protein RadA/Sms